ncbi:hypothetical protein FOMPIDRAFT_148672 [Fomitopsis schrenkii]|uniref:Uncharacterized protein n=1 Tax=Fomitopsis schrenkii TaxID=2126942 RepID=S8ELR8_FOMSC|nr:hypothetical protein FOMPIDRAFT_148672 [Fomitopsis schrenkii]
MQDSEVNNLIESIARVSVQDGDSGDTSTSKSEHVSSQPLRVYTRSQVLYLRDSPLVRPPEGMPSLKDWFGDWNEQQANAKKDNEPPSTIANGRERRRVFRRDAEDSDSSRPSFRSGLTQPSQMGNFRHQSLRTNDRDRDRDTERERERDLRDREGQERLRNLSDKYDRERLAMSSSASGLRGKERDSAPHLASAVPTRAGQVQGSSLAARRAEGRDPAKRKIGESNEDWRRGPDARPGKDGGSDTSRRDRDGRDRARSRARDTSRPRREPSTRRDRDERDKDRDKNRDRRGDDRDDSRRERDDHRREWDDFYNRGDRDRDDHYPRGERYRPRDAERDADDDPRRWRDDGKRDERMAARRERDRWDKHEERDRERPSEDSRPRRGAARDRRGANAEEGKDREDRREKEAEPAWMETYVPTTPSGGILGGRGADGELDGIQAWKKGMKEKERQEKESEAAAKAVEDAKSAPASAVPQSESPLDEIQMFRLMMKRDAEKKETGEHQKENAAPPPASEQGLSTLGSYHALPPRFLVLRVLPGSSAAAMNAPSQSVVDETQAIINRAHADGLSLAKAAAADGSQPLLSVLMNATTETVTPSASNRPVSVDSQPEGSRVLASRASSTLPPPPGVAAPGPLSNSSSVDASSNASTPSAFNPPTGSRLLAFGSRAPPGLVGHESIPPKNIPSLESPTAQFAPPGIPGLMPQKSSMNPPSTHPDMMSEAGYGNEPHFQHNGRHNLFEGVRMQRSFSPHSNLSQASGQFDDFHEIQMLGQMADLRRGSAVDRAGLGLANDVGPPFGDIGSSSPLDVNGIPGGPNYATGKGSRLARLMDQKARDAPPPANRKMPGMPGFPSNPQMSDPRQGNVVLNGGMNGNGDARTMEDIFAMLQNSAQHHRASPQIPSSGRIPSGGSPFGHSPSDLLQQQIHQQQHFPQNNHLDPLYDSRMDDRFVPDGMVPGLRPAPPRSRSREPSGVLFNEQLDDPLHFNARLQQQQQQQQQRNLDQIYPAQVPSMYSQQPTMLRNGGLPMQQQQYRGNPSPLSNQNVLGGPAQRLPPGLANLGGRPPHDPLQYLGGPINGMGGGLQGGMHAGQALQQAGFNTLGGGALGGAGLGGFGGGPQLRGPAPQNPLTLNSLHSMANLGLQNNLDLRAANQAQLLGMQGGMGGGLGGGLRGQGPGFGLQHGPSGQLPSQMSMRQQQQQQLPSHLMPHMLPQHLPQQQGLPGGTAQGTQDLMALLMGGHRE